MAVAGAGRLDPGRSAELQDLLNRWIFHPLAGRLARVLLPTGISANALSVAGLLAFFVSTWAYLRVDPPAGVLLGLAMMLLWHVFDGADGDLARLKGTSSPTGELVDGVCDYLGNTVMYFAFAFHLDNAIGGWAWLLAAGTGASHVLQTNHAESQRRAYLWRAYGVPWLRNAADAGDAVFRRESWFTRYFGFWAVGYMWLADRTTLGGDAIDAALTRAAGDAREIRRIRAIVRRASRGSLRFQKLLGANPKTFLIAASMALGSPIYYFLAMIFGVNLLLLASVVHHKRANSRIAASLNRR